jgi:hypothetical protein
MLLKCSRFVGVPLEGGLRCHRLKPALQGGGTIAGTLTQTGGTVKSETGPALSITGNYTQTAGNLTIEASSDTAWGMVTVTGSATLNGTHSVALLGGYAPNPGLQRTVISAVGGLTIDITEPLPGWERIVGPNTFQVKKL